MARLQGNYELSQFTRRLTCIGNALDGRVLAFEPAVDGPLLLFVHLPGATFDVGSRTAMSEPSR